VVDGHPGVVARRHHLHRRILQECRQAYVRQRRFFEKDPARLFNSGLDGNVRRAIDIHEGLVDASAFKALVRQAIDVNSSGKSKASRKRNLAARPVGRAAWQTLSQGRSNAEAARIGDCLADLLPRLTQTQPRGNGHEHEWSLLFYPGRRDCSGSSGSARLSLPASFQAASPSANT
jgi:hypothetical protein